MRNRPGFVDEPGVEVIWFIWTADHVAELDDARIVALRNSSTLDNPQKVKALKDFLDKNHNESPSVLSKESGIITAQGNDRFVIYRVELEHR